MTFSKDIQRHFDKRAANYDNPLTVFVGERELRAIRKFIPAGSDVLDYGCGTGRTTLDLLHRGCTVTAYDLSQEMMAIAAQRAARFGFSPELTADAQKLKGRVWPVVTCIGVLDYYRDPLPLLSELASYLLPHGKLIVTYPNAVSPLGWFYALYSRFRFKVILHTPGFTRLAASRAGLLVRSIHYAFPAVPLLGHTIVLEMFKIGVRNKIQQAVRMP